MINRNGSKWSREETILAFDLYCRISFSKISKLNPEIKELAEMLGRTPSSVALKMQNLAHFDPELKKRNVKAMAHGSKLDQEVFKEFCNDWTELAYQAHLIKANYQGVLHQDVLDSIDIEKLHCGEDRERLIKTRVGQYFFRMSVLNSYRGRCCVTGMKMPELLVASHIKPWSECNERTERTNPSNGLCLNALHDKAFDKGLITLDCDYKVIISRELKNVSMDEMTKEWFYGYSGKKIMLPDKFIPGREFIEYHNDMIFRG